MTHLLDYVTQIIAIPHEVTSCMSPVLIEPAVSPCIPRPVFSLLAPYLPCCECRGRLPALALIPLSLSLRPASDQ